MVPETHPTMPLQQPVHSMLTEQQFCFICNDEMYDGARRWLIHSDSAVGLYTAVQLYNTLKAWGMQTYTGTAG